MAMNEKLLRILNNRPQNYPHALADQFPHVFEKILELWDSPTIDTYFADLMVNKRTFRKGFPMAVASDIVYLSMVHSRQSQRADLDPWGQVADSLKREVEKQGVPFTREGFIKAAESGNQKAAALFLSAGMEVDVCDERKWTPLMISSFNGNEDMATLLIKSGANINHKDSAGYTPLHWASFNGFEQVVRLLLSRLADVNARSSHGWTPLMQAITRGHLLVSSVLIAHGADVNAATNDGWTPLHKAAANGNLAEVKLLLSKGARAKAEYGDGTTALDLAIKNKHLQIAAELAGRD
jgi:uncharacterized protein